MALINEGASFPSFIWAVTRLLLTLGGKCNAETARQLLTPITLPAGKTGDFGDAIKTLADLGLVTAANGTVELTPIARVLSPGDVVGFYGLLRRAALDGARNAGLADSPDLDGPKDLVRALSWFLTQDPTVPLSWEAAGSRQQDAFASSLPDPIANDVRWGRFVYWAPALGFAARPLLDQGGPVQVLPDCTTAVRETVLSLWEKGQQVNAVEAVSRILEQLPVLPGGAYSRSLGLAASNTVSTTLSNALLTGDEDGWITLDRRADADDMILLADVRSTRRVNIVTINGSN